VLSLVNGFFYPSSYFIASFIHSWRILHCPRFKIVAVEKSWNLNPWSFLSTFGLFYNPLVITSFYFWVCWEEKRIPRVCLFAWNLLFKEKCHFCSFFVFARTVRKVKFHILLTRTGHLENAVCIQILKSPLNFFFKEK